MIAIKTSSTQARFSRRAWLKGLGMSAAMLPLIHAERAIGATATGFPKRLVTVAWTNGVAQSAFYPQDNNPISGEVLTPFAPLASKVLFPAGLDLKVMLDDKRLYDGHFSYPTLYTGTYKNVQDQTGTATGPSVDQYVADGIAKKVNLPLPLMIVSVAGVSTSFRDGGKRNTGESDPARMFDTLFSSKNMSADQTAALRLRRQSVLDFVHTELTTFQGRLGTEDRAKIDAHLESVRQLELQISAGSDKTCTAPTLASLGDIKSYQGQVAAFNSLAAMALRCDLTRVVSMVWGADGGSSPGSFDFLGVSGDYHGIAHMGPAGYTLKIKIDKWLFTQVFNLAKMLDDTAEAGGTALDHSVIVTANDMNEGNGHYVGGVPYFMVGSCGGFFKTGRVVKLGKWAGKTGNYYSSDSGIANNKLLASLCNAMDVPTDSFGTGYPGSLTELQG